MAMYGDTRFRGASIAATPKFAAAAARQGQMENEAQQQENAQLSNNVMGAGKLYNEAMGENTPLADMAAQYFGTDEAGIGMSPELINALRIGQAPSAAVDASALAAQQAEASMAAAEQGQMAADYYSGMY